MKKTLAVIFLLVMLSAGCTKKTVYKATLVELMASGCNACENLKPVMDELKKEYKGLVKFMIYDVKTPEGSEKAAGYTMKGTPTLIFLDENGMEYFRLENTMQKDVIAALLNIKTGPPKGK